VIDRLCSIALHRQQKRQLVQDGLGADIKQDGANLNTVIVFWVESCGLRINDQEGLDLGPHHGFDRNGWWS
tara:strand:- start:14319 stop:14531 length:213 start_codon:yes stop_codon:yes gene_type:complete